MSTEEGLATIPNGTHEASLALGANKSKTTWRVILPAVTPTIGIVTHNMQQAARVSDHTGFILLCELIDVCMTKAALTTPKDKRTADYITGRFG